jgi:hypothetical protein
MNGSLYRNGIKLSLRKSRQYIRQKKTDTLRNQVSVSLIQSAFFFLSTILGAVHGELSQTEFVVQSLAFTCFYRVFQRSQAFDLHHHFIAVPQFANTCGGSGENKVTRFKGHDR